MKAAEIRAEAKRNVESFADAVAKNLLHPITVANYGAAMEIAAQLAEFNEKLEPDAIFATFKKVGDQIEKMSPEEHRRNL